MNELGAGSFFSVMSGTDLFKAYNNILAGGGTFTSGGWPATVDTLSNLVTSDIASVLFDSPATYDYHISIASPAHNFGFPAGLSNTGYPLVAWDEYVHPLASVTRCQHATLDIGAFETCTTDIVERAHDGLMIFPNPATDHVQVSLAAGALPTSIEIVDTQGRVLLRIPVNGRPSITLDVHDLPAGAHLLRAAGATTTLRRFVTY